MRDVKGPEVCTYNRICEKSGFDIVPGGRVSLVTQVYVLARGDVLSLFKFYLSLGRIPTVACDQSNRTRRDSRVQNPQSSECVLTYARPRNGRIS
jgi:hypothetical protein